MIKVEIETSKIMLEKDIEKALKLFYRTDEIEVKVLGSAKKSKLEYVADQTKIKKQPKQQKKSFFSFFRRKKLIDKDLKDFTLTKNSKPWKKAKMYKCTKCGRIIDSYEYVDEYCKACGYSGSQLHEKLLIRKLVHQGKWIYQTKDKDNKTELMEKHPDVD